MPKVLHYLLRPPGFTLYAKGVQENTLMVHVTIQCVLSYVLIHTSFKMPKHSPGELGVPNIVFLRH